MACFVTNRRKSVARSALAIGVALGFVSPAQAEMISLICSYEGVANFSLHVNLDTDRQTVATVSMQSGETRRDGPFAASISDTFIRWTENTLNRESRYTIDRVAGTISDLRFYRGDKYVDYSGQCRRATQKF